MDERDVRWNDGDVEEEEKKKKKKRKEVEGEDGKHIAIIFLNWKTTKHLLSLYGGGRRKSGT